MGFFDTLRSAVGLGGGSMGSGPSRTDIIVSHYDVTKSQASTIADIVESGVGHGVSRSELNAKVSSAVNLPYDQIKRMVATEHASIALTRQVEQYRTQGPMDERVFRWTGPEDGHAICTETARMTAERNGVPLDELVSLLTDHAEAHAEGTPERMGHWVPHERCQYTLVEHFE